MMPFKNQDAATNELRANLQARLAEAAKQGPAPHRAAMLAAGACPEDVALLDKLGEVNQLCQKLGMPEYGALMGHIVNNLNAFRGQETNEQQMRVRSNAFKDVRQIVEAMQRIAAL